MLRKSCRILNPYQWTARDQVNVSAAFMSECSGLQCTLASADNRHRLSRKASKGTVSRSMRHHVRRQMAVLGWLMNVVGEARRHHDSLRGYFSFVLKSENEEAVLLLDRPDVSLVCVGNRVPVKPETIVDNGLARHRIRRALIADRTKPVQPIFLFGIGNIGGPPERTQQHPLRHLLAPQLHRFAEDNDIQSSIRQVRSCREPVWTRSNDGDIIFGVRRTAAVLPGYSRRADDVFYRLAHTALSVLLEGIPLTTRESTRIVKARVVSPIGEHQPQHSSSLAGQPDNLHIVPLSKDFGEDVLSNGNPSTRRLIAEKKLSLDATVQQTRLV